MTSSMSVVYICSLKPFSICAKLLMSKTCAYVYWTCAYISNIKVSCIFHNTVYNNAADCMVLHYISNSCLYEGMGPNFMGHVSMSRTCACRHMFDLCVCPGFVPLSKTSVRYFSVQPVPFYRKSLYLCHLCLCTSMYRTCAYPYDTCLCLGTGLSYE